MKLDNRMVKSPEALAAIRAGGKILGEVLAQAAAAVKVGASTKSLDELAEKLIRAAGGRPAFLGYKISSRDNAYPATLCVSVNDEVVHGIPKLSHIIQDGDIVGLDIGMEWPYTEGGPKGFFTDTAISVIAGTPRPGDTELLARTYESLRVGIAAAHLGNEIKDISRAIENSLKPYPYGVVRDLVGHGVGYAVHEEPQVPNFVDRRTPTVRLLDGMVLALEPMVTTGGMDVYTEKDGWTVRTEDGSRSAHFEHTIIISPTGPEIVTLRPGEKM
jgi:methionyl aminopeptidase